MKLFISHISEELSVATVLKEWIESSFVGKCDVVVSSDSDKDDIPAGSKWLEEIDKALGEAVTLIVLCSPTSLARPWINFETGCGWIKRVPIIPVCHSGQKKGALPPPISMFQALELDNESFVSDLLSSLAKHLGFSKIPRIDLDAMKRELLAAVAVAKAEAASAPKERVAVPQEDIPQEAIEILKVLGQESGRGLITAQQLSTLFNMTEQRTQYFLDLLVDKRLIHRALYVGRPSTYSLNLEGRKYLFERGML